MPEKYVVSEEEMHRAEATLLPQQAELSNKREHAHKLLREAGVEGWLTYDQYGTGEDDYPLTSEIKGELNGHKIHLVSGGPYDTKSEIDGLEMSHTASSAVWQKYGAIARLQLKAAIEEAGREVHYLPKYNPAHDQAAEKLRDIV